LLGDIIALRGNDTFMINIEILFLITKNIKVIIFKFGENIVYKSKELKKFDSNQKSQLNSPGDFHLRLLIITRNAITCV
jgi:hypothetical protein